VLGASSRTIAFLLTNEFLKIIVIAIVIAFPIAWVIMHQWLQQYAYKIGMEWWMFAAAGLATLVITLLTVSYQSIKAALVNPVNSLKSE